MILADDALVVGLIKPVLATLTDLSYQLGIELWIIYWCQVVNLLLDYDADKASRTCLSSGSGRELLVVAMNDA